MDIHGLLIYGVNNTDFNFCRQIRPIICYLYSIWHVRTCRKVINNTDYWLKIPNLQQWQIQCQHRTTTEAMMQQILILSTVDFYPQNETNVIKHNTYNHSIFTICRDKGFIQLLIIIMIIGITTKVLHLWKSVSTEKLFADDW